jgi:predicted RNase H-related nuclease YkuK (DUF458 family)
MMSAHLTENSTWCTGSGDSISLKESMKIMSKHAQSGGKIFIGTDSCLSGDRFVFATAICVHGANNQSGGKYFFKRGTVLNQKIPTLFHRISQEVQNTIETALYVESKIPNAEIEIHLDIGTNPIGKTWKFVDSLTGYARSTGMPVKIKPYAWASASIADKHSK